MLLGFTHYFGGQSQKRSKLSELEIVGLAVRILRVNCLNTNRSAIKICMMNRHIRVEKILVQFNVLLLVAQSKSNPSKHEICLLRE